MRRNGGARLGRDARRRVPWQSDAVRADLLAALPGWVAGRLLVGVAWLVTVVIVDIRLDGVRPVPMAFGLFGWDGAYYRDIAELGYFNADATRFHPLLPLLGVNGFGVLLLANLGALAAGALVHRLVVERIGDADLARRSATLVGIAPPAFAMVWGYAEGPFLALAAAQLLALGRRRWWWAAAFGALATLTRPSGALLAVPALIEAVAGVGAVGPPRIPLRRIWGRAAAVVAPVGAFAAYLAWVEERFGDAFLPLRIQSDLRGGFAILPLRLAEGVGEVVVDPFGDGAHLPFALGMIALVWVAWTRLPASWAALATASVLVNLSADNWNSIERYAYGTVPLGVALAAATGGRRWRWAVVVSSILLVGMTAVAWYGRFVP
jgi:hypothetical protein